MDIQDLKYILAIAKNGNFSETAYEVSLSQSSLSKHVQKVERELGGIQLFDRSTRSVKLTAAGTEFVKHARRIVAGFEELHSAMRKQASYLTGKVRVGTIPILGRLGLASSIASFNRKYPGIRVEIKEGKTMELIKSLYCSEVDVAFVVMSNNNENKSLSFHPVIEDELVLVVDVLHPFAKKGTIDLAEAANENFIFPDDSSSMYELGVEACLKAGFTPNQAYKCGQVEMILELVSERVGVTIMAKKVFLSSSSNFAYTTCLSLKSKIQRITALALPNHSTLSPSVELFTRHILQNSIVQQ